MNIIPETKACESCAKAKRKCGKERPKCHRCSSRDLQCEYPPARPTAFVLLQDDDDSEGYPQSRDTSETTAVSVTDLWSPSMLFCQLADFDVPPLPSSNDLGLRLQTTCTKSLSIPAKHLSCDWFMSPDTWKSAKSTRDGPIPCDETENTPPFGNGVLKRFLKDIQQRLGQWVSTGSTTFIHKHLYTFRNPRCILDAQTTLALYLSRTDENEDMVFRSLDDRAKQLLQDENKHQTSSSHSTFDHLARVQALLTYQVVGLLDGDIHQRATAEERTETLMLWVDQMIESVRVASTFVSSNEDVDHSVVTKGLGLGIKSILPDDQKLLSPITQEEVVWHVWLFAESLRRTWITVQGLHATYHALKKGWALCPGSMRVTAGQGMWDAPSSYAWAQVISKTNVWFMEGSESETLLEYAVPEEVDDFARSFMQITHGTERMERWGVVASL